MTAGVPDFLFDIQFDVNDRDLARGKAILSIRGQQVWYQQDVEGDVCPVDWTWVDLLAFLSRNWSALTLEEVYPFGLTPENPNQLYADAERRWNGLDSEQVKSEDIALFRFERRHDLATGLKGIFLPAVFVLREGSIAWVCTPDFCYRFVFDVMCSALESIGDLIAQQLQNTTNPRAIKALNAWRSRGEISLNQLVQYRGVPALVELSGLQDDAKIREYWELEPQGVDSELFAFARLSAGKISLEDQRLIVEELRSQPPIVTSDLDALSLGCEQLLDKISEMRAYEQGYSVASWFRDRLRIVDVFDPEAVLQYLHVAIEEINITDCAVEALACWGPMHGPVVMLNVAGEISGKPAGRRSTLAHELGHLLMDRHGSLPLAEVFGGSTPEWIEKRARAFAAEVLLPRELAKANMLLKYDQIEDIDSTIDALCRRFNVSEILATHQLYNSGVASFFDARMRSHLEVRHNRFK